MIPLIFNRSKSAHKISELLFPFHFLSSGKALEIKGYPDALPDTIDKEKDAELLQWLHTALLDVRSRFVCVRVVFRCSTSQSSRSRFLKKPHATVCYRSGIAICSRFSSLDSF